MIWTFIAGMLCGAAILILLILVSDRSFLELLVSRLTEKPSEEPERPLEVQSQQSVAVGGDS